MRGKRKKKEKREAKKQKKEGKKKEGKKQEAKRRKKKERNRRKREKKRRGETGKPVETTMKPRPRDPPRPDFFRPALRASPTHHSLGYGTGRFLRYS